tara:strand:- start:58 stop:489 length:432 start_codon:yes stop_codon:yes gene_type:complete
MNLTTRRLIASWTMLLSINLAAQVPTDETVMALFEEDIADGATSEVSELMARMVAFNEPEMLVYGVFISEDRSRITFMEIYSNTEAMLFHDKRFTRHFANDLFPLTINRRLATYGAVSEKYKAFATASGFTLEFSDMVSGFSW